MPLPKETMRNCSCSQGSNWCYFLSISILDKIPEHFYILASAQSTEGTPEPKSENWDTLSYRDNHTKSSFALTFYHSVPVAKHIAVYSKDDGLFLHKVEIFGVGRL